jgi:hypothetical protein
MRGAGALPEPDIGSYTATFADIAVAPGRRLEVREHVQPFGLAGIVNGHVFVAGHVRLSLHHESRLKPRPRPGFRDRPVAACAVLTDHSNDDMRGSEQVKPPAGRELVCSRLQFHWIFGGSLKLSGGGKSGIGFSIYFILILDGLIMPRSIQ